ncbi:EF-hand domain-containing protein [Marilutibacter chinensis]|uniref:Calcium-binding protein n=1 Tax=Marilutibacter chinensis TaxID=2912247 RepID=A0ABS9HQ83_9GAMM|nr:calcium-binding protein [Lysobacter chinensis]MCF7221095.1 calcium-binding protein [Lysobacter chinensis]
MALAALVAGTAFAAGADGNREHGHPHRMAKLDSNGDGSIDRNEAAAAPRLAGHFDRLDANGDGRLDASERPARHARHRDGRGHGRHGGLARIVALDTDQDGRISKVEAAEAPRLAGRFDDMDGNRDGYIVRSELRTYRERMRAEHVARAAERREAKFKQADGNGDGRLSRSEVEAGMPRMSGAFAFMDENRDGYLSREELQPPRRR